MWIFSMFTKALRNTSSAPRRGDVARALHRGNVHDGGQGREERGDDRLFYY